MSPRLHTLHHALSLLRPWYARRHLAMREDCYAGCMTAAAVHRESRMLTWIVHHVDEASRELSPLPLPGYRYCNGDLLDCLDDQIERLITADAVTIADIEALAETRGLFMDGETPPDPAELDVEIDLAWLLQGPSVAQEDPRC